MISTATEMFTERQDDLEDRVSAVEEDNKRRSSASQRAAEARRKKKESQGESGD